MVADSVIAVGIGIFLATYLIIAFEKLHRTIAALLGGCIMSLLLILAQVEVLGEEVTFPDIINHVSWSTVLFVTGMMVIVSIAGRSGVFQFVALELVKFTKGEPITLFFMFITLTFFMSFILDTITTMLVIAPLTIEIYNALEYDSRPVLISEALASNYGSVGSLVGSVPNIVIGETSGLSFLDYLIFLGPLAFLFFLSSLPVFYLLNRKQFAQEQRTGIEGILLIDSSSVIEDHRMFFASIVTLIAVLIGFILGQFTPLDPSVVALTGAALLLAVSGGTPEQTFEDVEWNMVFFLVGLFILIGGIEILGILDSLADAGEPFFEEDAIIGIGLAVWFSAILSAVVDNIPVSAALVAVFAKMTIEEKQQKFIYFSLVVGTNVGGNMLPIGSPANILAMSLSERSKNRITFFQFMKVGALMALIHLVIATVYLTVLYQILYG
ncbi:MAG: SLC13 family permease [Candidatus Heimdallarchaeota archaeon]